VKLALLFVFVALTACHHKKEVFVIRPPFSTFCPEYAPEPMPKLVREGRQMFLQLPFTPAEDRQADAIVAAVKQGPTIMRIEGTDREFIAQHLGPRCIEVYVDSAEQAEAILLDLGFKKEESKLPLPPNT
jgi:hypothetical protein